MPDTPEQITCQRIDAQFVACLNVVDQLGQGLSAHLQDAARLRHSLLQKAFTSGI